MLSSKLPKANRRQGRCMETHSGSQKRTLAVHCCSPTVLQGGQPVQKEDHNFRQCISVTVHRDLALPCLLAERASPLYRADQGKEGIRRFLLKTGGMKFTFHTSVTLGFKSDTILVPKVHHHHLISQQKYSPAPRRGVTVTCCLP